MLSLAVVTAVVTAVVRAAARGAAVLRLNGLLMEIIVVQTGMKKKKVWYNALL